MGSHSRSHIRLRGLDVVALQQEIGDSKRMLEDLLGKQMEHLPIFMEVGTILTRGPWRQ
ncbi:MAG: hypothetical protein HPY67_00240 [Syntrophaceae bacterium]|nr:hypothetical protein [Syntrophaceae bacterium]